MSFIFVHAGFIDGCKGMNPIVTNKNYQKTYDKWYGLGYLYQTFKYRKHLA